MYPVNESTPAPAGSTLAAACADDAATVAAESKPPKSPTSVLRVVSSVSVQEVRSVARVGSKPEIESVTDATIGAMTGSNTASKSARAGTAEPVAAAAAATSAPSAPGSIERRPHRRPPDDAAPPTPLRPDIYTPLTAGGRSTTTNDHCERTPPDRAATVSSTITTRLHRVKPRRSIAPTSPFSYFLRPLLCAQHDSTHGPAPHRRSDR